MSHSCFRVDHIRTLTCNGWIIVVDHKIPSHTRCQIDQYISPTVSNPFHRIFEQVDVTAANTRFRVAHVDVDDRGPGIRRLYCRISNLFRRDRHVGMLADGITCSSHRTGDDHFSVHLHGVLLITAFSSASLHSQHLFLHLLNSSQANHLARVGTSIYPALSGFPPDTGHVVAPVH